MKSKNNYQEWFKKGVPAILIPGLIFASVYGVKNLNKLRNYYNDEKVFPKYGILSEVEDGDTFRLQSGQTVRLLGINSPDRGKMGFEEAKNYLKKTITDKKLWLEYDRYQDDKYGRILAWIWVDCDGDKVEILPADYMHLNGKESREYVNTNPKGCQSGKLVNREMVNSGNAAAVSYEGRGRLKYKL